MAVGNALKIRDYICANRGRVVTMAELIEAVWPGGVGAPSGPSRNISVYLNRVRKECPEIEPVQGYRLP